MRAGRAWQRRLTSGHPLAGGRGVFLGRPMSWIVQKVTILGNTDLPKHGPLLGNSKGVEPHEAPMSRRAPKAPSLAPPSPPQSTGILASYICKSFIDTWVQIHIYRGLDQVPRVGEYNQNRLRISLNSWTGGGEKRLKSLEPGLEPQHRSLLIHPTICTQIVTHPLGEWI